MRTSEPPSSLALDDIMLIDDDDEGNSFCEPQKIADIQDQLQKQAEIIRDLLVQRGFLINQILQERERWQAERDGWDRTSEALIARKARKESDSVNEEELKYRCAVYESDNKVLKEKLQGTQARLTDLETELSKLKPLLVMKPSLHLPSHQMRSAVAYHYTQMRSYISPFSPTLPYTPLSSYNVTPTPASVAKRKGREYSVDPSPGKGKEKEVTNDDTSDSNADGDTDTEAPPTPTPVSASQNPYAYMNDLYRQSISLSKPSNIPSPLKPPDTPSATAFTTSSPSGGPPFNHCAAPYSYPHAISPFSKQPSSSAPSRSDDVDKDGSQGESHADVQESSSKREKPRSSTSKSVPRSARRAATTRRSQQQGKQKATTLLSDARAEHLLLAARMVGRERAAAIAGLAIARDKPAPEGINKDKARNSGRRTEAASASTSARRSAQQRTRAMAIQSPSTPTPRRVQGPTDSLLTPLTHLSSSNVVQYAGASRETLVSSSRTPRTISGVNASARSLSKDTEDAGSGQTPLDSLLSAARTMMTEDTQVSPGQRMGPPNSTPDATEDTNKRPVWGPDEGEGAQENTSRKKRRRNGTTCSPVTPRPRHVKNQRVSTLTSNREDASLKHAPVPAAATPSSTPASTRTRSALDVLADQAAAASGGGSVIHHGGHQGELGDHAVIPAMSSVPNSGPLTDETGAHMGASFVSTRPLEETIKAVVSPALGSCPLDEENEATEVGKDVDKNVDKNTTDGNEVKQELMQASSYVQIEDNGNPGLSASLPPGAATPQHDAPLGSIPIKAFVELGSGTIVRPEGQAAHADGSIIAGSDPFGSGPNLATLTDLGGESESEGDLDAEGDIDPDSHDSLYSLFNA